MTKSGISLKAIFILFFKMGTFAFGGVYSMLALFEKELVQKKKWLTHDEFTESAAMGQITPGAPIVNTGIFIGYRLAGFWGGVTTIAGQTLPAFVMITLLATFYLKYKDMVIFQSALKGIGAAVVGLVFSVVVNMGKKTITDKTGLLLFLSAIIMVIGFKTNPLIILLLAVILGISLLKK